MEIKDLKRIWKVKERREVKEEEWAFLEVEMDMTHERAHEKMSRKICLPKGNSTKAGTSPVLFSGVPAGGWTRHDPQQAPNICWTNECYCGGGYWYLEEYLQVLNCRVLLSQRIFRNICGARKGLKKEAWVSCSWPWVLDWSSEVEEASVVVRPSGRGLPTCQTLQDPSQILHQ